jgi:peptide deformylase
VVDVGRSSGRLVLINPRIVEAGTEMESAEEGCLSIPDVYADVDRPHAIVLEAMDQDGKPYRIPVTGFRARAVQHEIDHLDGILFLDRLSAVKRALLLSKWKKLRKGMTGHIKEVTPEPAGDR